MTRSNDRWGVLHGSPGPRQRKNWFEHGELGGVKVVVKLLMLEGFEQNRRFGGTERERDKSENWEPTTVISDGQFHCSWARKERARKCKPIYPKDFSIAH